MNFIIDGYNLAFMIDKIAQSVKNGNTEKAINQVIHYVQQKFVAKHPKIIIVFDGQNYSDFEKNYNRNLTILFSKKPQTADDIIRNFIRKTEQIKNWVVVTSDNEIIYTAKDLGAGVMKSTDFIKMNVSGLPKKSTAVENKKMNPGNVDIEYWRNIFNSGKDE